MEETNNIHDTLLLAIKDAHVAAEQTTNIARGNMETAIDRRIKCAALVEKAKLLHPQDLAGYLSDADITGEEVKGYLSLHDAASKRPALHDKRQLQLCGILEAAERPEQPDQPKRKPTPSSVISTSSAYIGKLNKAIDRRPVKEWDASEREQVKDVLKPLMELYGQL